MEKARTTTWRRVLRRVLKLVIGWRFRRFDPNQQPARWVHVAGLRLRVLPGVFNPALHFTSLFLAEYLRRPNVIKPNSLVLDLGTGAGIAAIAAAQSGAARVLATDINPDAVRSATLNVRHHGLQDYVQVVQGDLFAPVAGEQFGLIISNPPYFRGIPQTLAERAYKAGANYEWIDRFASEAPFYLSHGGKVLLVLGDAADIPEIMGRMRAAGWQVSKVARRDIIVEVLYIFCMRWPSSQA